MPVAVLCEGEGNSMLAKLALLVQSKVALAVLGAGILATGGTAAALAATGHMPRFAGAAAAQRQVRQGANDKATKTPASHAQTVAIVGTLSAYDAGAKTITVNPADGSAAITVAVNDQTRVNGERASSLADLTAAVGRGVQVQADKQTDGSLVAWKITVQGAGSANAGQQREVTGTVTGVTGNQLVVKLQDGTSLTVVVGTGATVAGAAKDVASIKAGVRIQAHGTMQADGTLLADRVQVEDMRGKGGGDTPGSQGDDRGGRDGS